MTIYLLTLTKYVEDFLAGFAVNESGIRQIVINHHRESFGEKVEVEIDMETMRARVNSVYTYVIHKIERVT